ncbi:GNAT family N-acetyltransferase [Intrasporangium sp. YIM S08009]|uniref:GNAT family N-acetyltransferase n=1 Tax=Intrasporangium zincisolvens TaxID=3080018 RepID=UPI002B05AE27|nr:GNAT family N-acetyltransferase [Intrasporangium sp. YIM S08009]
MTDVRPFRPTDADGVAALCRELGWPSFSDPAVAARACTAPGVVAWVAVERDGPVERDGRVDRDESVERVVAFAQAFGDGVVQSYLAQLGVAATHRRHGVGRRLVEAVFAASGTQRIDLVTDDAQDFYRSFAHREKPGFRLYPDAPRPRA